MTPSNNVPAFTDSDLKRLKEHLMFQTVDEKQADLVRALLARLEAGEYRIARSILTHTAACDGVVYGDGCSCGAVEADNAWLRSKGEGL